MCRRCALMYPKELDHLCMPVNHVTYVHTLEPARVHAHGHTLSAPEMCPSFANIGGPHRNKQCPDLVLLARTTTPASPTQPPPPRLPTPHPPHPASHNHPHPTPNPNRQIRSLDAERLSEMVCAVGRRCTGMGQLRVPSTRNRTSRVGEVAGAGSGAGGGGGW